MAHSRLTVRTLGLATIALVLACGHAVQAMQAKRTPTAKTSSRMVARSATKVAVSRPTAAGGGSSRVATVRGGTAGGSSGSVASFSGEAGVFRPPSSIASEIRISTPAHPYPSRRAHSRRAASANVRHITVSTAAARAPERAKAKAARKAAHQVPPEEQPRIADPAIAAALRSPVQRPAPERNAFAMGLAAVALVTPATGVEAQAVRPRAASRTSGKRR